MPAQYHPELFALMAQAAAPATAFVAKGYCAALQSPAEATGRGYRNWGYYHAADLAADTQLLATTQARWTTLGLDYSTPQAVWNQVKAYGKPVLAHVVPDASAAQTARRRDADGIVASGVREVLDAARS